MQNNDLLFDENFNLPLQDKDIEPLKKYLYQKKGWVYIAKTKDNHLLKIGRTKKNPLERAKSLSSTGVLNDYEIVFALPVFNQFIVEKRIHKKLKKYRVLKEFFSVNLDLAIETFESEYKIERDLLNRFLDVHILDGDIDLLEYAIKKQEIDFL